MGCCKDMSKAEKIGSIITGWANVIWKDKKTEAEALRRIKICSTCVQNRNNKCGSCNCWIPAKARSMVEHCPINLWHE